MSPARKKQLIAVAALGIAGAALAYIAFGGIENNLVYYWDVAELVAKGKAAEGATVRLGGVVQKGSIDWNTSTLDLKFKVGMQPDAGAVPQVVVKASGAPPQMFREGIGVVVEGRYDGSQFNAERVMVKHSNEYRPPTPGEDPREVYKTLSDATN